MTKEIKFLKRIKNYIEESNKKLEEERQKEKERIYNLLVLPWTVKQLEEYYIIKIPDVNTDTEIAFEEYSIKRNILISNAYLFSEEEYKSLHQFLKENYFSLYLQKRKR